jgi:CubicO group peptidase (beta-lactamase class C family)
MGPKAATPPKAVTPNDRDEMGRRDWLVASGTLLVGAWTTAPHTAPTPLARSAASAIQQSSDDIPRLLALAGVPGMSIATVRGANVTAEGFGVRRSGTEDGVTGDTVFEAASLSKPVFASIVMQLAAERVIDLTRPLGEYLPLPNPADERAKRITATHVLSHSGGWRNWRNNRDVMLTSDFEPGTRFTYSGEGYFFLQRVVEKLTGKALPRLARERVFEPLGMRSSSFLWRPELDATLASPHTNRAQPMDSFNARMGRAYQGLVAELGKPVEDWTAADVEKALPRVDANLPVLPNFLMPNAAASLVTSARDYGTFVRWLFGAGPVQGGRAVLDRMIVQQSIINDALGWGSGIGLEQAGGRRYFWHWGDNPGFKNFIVGEPAAGSAVVIFTNGNAGQRVYERVVRSRTGVDHPAFLWL